MRIEWYRQTILLLTLCFIIVPSLVSASVMDDAISAISVAKIQLVNAYELTLQLEQTGGNITELTLTLNEAGLLLSNAEHAYSIGDLDAAKNLAIQSQNLLEGFADKAGALKEEASQQAANDFWFKIIYPIFGSFAVIAVGFAVWYLLKRKYDASGVIENDLKNYRIVFIVVILLAALFVASPAIQKVLVYPSVQSASFSELWLLGPEKKAENYTSSISRNENYTVYLGVANQLGSCAYYRVDVKLCNATQQPPSSFNRTASTQPSLYSMNLIVPDKGNLEMPLSFSFNYTFDEMLYQINFVDLTLNGLPLNLEGYTVAWTPQGAFSVDLIFELWIYNSATNVFDYHERYVGLHINIGE